MSLNELQTLCKQLKLAYVAQIVETKNDSSYTQNVCELLKEETLRRQSAKLTRLVKQASFSSLKTFEDYNYDDIYFKGRYDAHTLRTLEWIDKKENIILMGNVGTGKTHI